MTAPRQRVLVIGASGYLGRAVIAELAAADIRVDRGGRGCDVDVNVDISDSDSIANAVTRARYSVVVNLAAYGVDAAARSTADFDRMVDVNAVGPSMLCMELAKVSESPRLIHVASCRESLDGPPDPVRLTYAITKRAGTGCVLGAIRAQRLHGVVLRLHAVYGGAQPRTRFVGSVVESARQGSTFTIKEPGASLDFVHVTDVVRAIRIAIVNPISSGEVLDVGTGSCTSVVDLARRLYSAVGADEELVLEGQAACVPYRVGCDTARAMSILGWSAEVGLDRGVVMALEEL